MTKYFYSLLFLLSLQSCYRDRIELDLNEGENKKVVVTAWITSIDESQYVDLSYTANYLGNEIPEKIAGAAVQISDELETYTLLEKTDSEKGRYFLPDFWTPRIGDNYKLKINYDGKEYTSEHQMRFCPELENVYADLIPEDEGFDFPAYETFMSFLETPGTGDAYYAMDYRKGSLRSDSLFSGGFADDAFVDGLYFEDIELTDWDHPFELGDTAVIEFHSIGLETANFLQDIQSEVFRGSPFDPPPTNVRTNITGGAIGYFIVADAKRHEFVIQ